MSVNRIRDFAASLGECLEKVVQGHSAAVRELTVALLAGGHVLLEGPPGLGKTLLIQTLSRLLRAEYRRIQFTPDLMPADVIGTTVFRPATGSFEFSRGPVFTQILLADEINRTPPKTQAALLEAMQERQVTVDGTSHALPREFFVAATQNPVEYEGTYPLPEAQLDRFFMKIQIDYSDGAAERRILDAHADGLEFLPAAASDVRPILGTEELGELRREAAAVFVEESVRDYIVGIIRASRGHRRVSLGGSSRAAIALLFAAKTTAACAGRGFVRPDDVKAVAPAVLRHRLVLRPDAEVEGIGVGQVVADLVASVEVHAAGQAAPEQETP